MDEGLRGWGEVMGRVLQGTFGLRRGKGDILIGGWGDDLSPRREKPRRDMTWKKQGG